MHFLPSYLWKHISLHLVKLPFLISRVLFSFDNQTKVIKFSKQPSVPYQKFSGLSINQLCQHFIKSFVLIDVKVICSNVFRPNKSLV